VIGLRTLREIIFVMIEPFSEEVNVADDPTLACWREVKAF